MPKNVLFSGPAHGEFVGVFLANLRSEHHVFRVAVFSVVFTLTVGQNAALLYRMWCDSQTAAASGCHDEDSATSPSVVGDDTCDNMALSAAPFLREEVRRSVSSPNEDNAIPVPRYQLAHLTTDARPGHEPRGQWSLDHRPLATALRI